MATLREWFDQFTAETGEHVEQVVFSWGWRDYKAEDWPDLPPGVVGVTDVGNDILDRTFDDSWGGNESPNLCGWSPSFVVFSDNYDGAEGIQWVPRNPVAHDPIRPGGG